MRTKFVWFIIFIVLFLFLIMSTILSSVLSTTSKGKRFMLLFAIMIFILSMIIILLFTTVPTLFLETEHGIKIINETEIETVETMKNIKKEDFQGDSFYWEYDTNDIANDLMLDEDTNSKTILSDDVLQENDKLVQKAKDDTIEKLKMQARKHKNDDYLDELMLPGEKDKYTDQELVNLKKDRLNEMMNDEFKLLTDERYSKATEFVSQRLLQDEYSSPYNILPMDLWYRPPDGAKDIFKATPCMCPAELILNKNVPMYSEYK